MASPRRPRLAVAGALALALAAACASESHAGLWWRDGVKSAWTRRPASSSTDPAQWSDAETTYETDFDVQAKNDDTNLYLFISADGDDGKSLLLGSFRQDLTLWFFKPDGKTRDWGVRLGFDSLGLPEPGSWRIAPGQDLEPAYPDLSLIQLHDTAISTAPLSGGITVRSAMSGKEPVLIVTVPLEHLAAINGKVSADFTSSLVSKDVMAVVQRWDAHSRPHEHSSGDGGPLGDSGSSGSSPSGGRHGRRGRGGGHAPAAVTETSVPDNLDLRMAVRIAAPSAE